MELLAKVIELDGRLLQVDRGSPAGGNERDEMCAPAILLRFDVAQVLVMGLGKQALDILQVESPEAVGVPLAAGSEDEPWWRVLGSPLAQLSNPEVDESGALQAIRLQFRADDQNPCFITLRFDTGMVRAQLSLK
jgi:hypothetical protein